MNANEILNLDDTKYGLLFDTRRSIRYHDLRLAFYENWHKITNIITIMMAGIVLMDLAKIGDMPLWAKVMSIVAVFLSAFDLVIGYGKMATLHGKLRNEFADLEIDMLSGSIDEKTWLDHVKKRLEIEKNEPPVYTVLDGLCRNAILRAEGHKDEKLFNSFNWFKRATKNLLRWESVKTV